MALNIKNAAVERLASEVAQMTGETKTETIRKALEERKARLRLDITEGRAERLRRFLEREIWPQIPDAVKGTCLTAAEESEILGYGPQGV